MTTAPQAKPFMARVRDRALGRVLRLVRPKKNFMCRDHFMAQSDPHKAAWLFKRSVRFIYLEPSSYCNRVCTYCPNAFIDRRSEHLQMDDALFANIVGALSTIDYDQVLGLHLYNEPLADRDYFIKRLKQVRAKVPKAKVEIYTNGDYLKPDYVDELYRLGCKRMHATAHVKWDDYDPARAREHLLKRVEKLGYDYTITDDTPTQTQCEIHVGPDMLFTYQITNFLGTTESGETVANDRGQSLDVVTTDYERTSPCLRQFEELLIDYTGAMLPCCHIRPDVPGLEHTKMGQVTGDSDLFLLWANAHYAAWRRSMITYEVKDAPCTTCNYKTVGEHKRIRAWSRWVADHPQ